MKVSLPVCQDTRKKYAKWYAQKGHKYSDLSPPVCPPFCHFRSTLQECITSCVFVVGRSLVGSLPAFCSAARAILLHARVGCGTVVYRESAQHTWCMRCAFPSSSTMLCAWSPLSWKERAEGTLSPGIVAKYTHGVYASKNVALLSSGATWS